MEVVKNNGNNNGNNNGKDKKRKKGIIITGGVIGVAAVGAVTAALLVKSCQENDGVNYTISHANLSQAQVTELAFEYAEGSTIQITSFDPNTKQIHGTVTNAKATGGKVNTANVTGAGYGGNDSKDGIIDAANPAAIDHALFSGEFDGTFNGDVKSITGNATSGFAISGIKWSVSNASASGATFNNFFATSGAIVDAVVKPSNPSSPSNPSNNPTPSGNNSAPSNTSNNQTTQNKQDVQTKVQQTIIDAVNTPAPNGQTPQTPIQIVTQAIDKADYQPTTTIVVPAKPTDPFVVPIVPKTTPTAAPTTISVVVPPVIDHSAEIAQFNNPSTAIPVPSITLDETNWNQPISFDLSAFPQGTTIASITPPSTQPTGATADYQVDLSYNGSTRTVTVSVPYTAPSQDVLDQRALDAVAISSKVTLHEAGNANLDATNLAWGTTLTEKDFDVALPQNATLSAFTTSEKTEPTNDKVVSFETTLTLGRATRTVTVPVNYKAPKPVDINKAAADAATINLNVPTTLNESNWNALTANDFKTVSPRTDIAITSATAQTTTPTQDGDITYDVVVTVGTGADAQTSTKQVKVPFKALLNRLTASTTRKVDDSNWDKLTANDFVLSQQGLTITSAIAQTTQPTADGTVDYRITVSLGNKTQTVDAKVNFTKIVGNITSSKTSVDETNWDKLTQADFNLNITSPTGLTGAYVSDVKSKTTTVPTRDGNIDYEVTYTYRTFSETKTVTVPFVLSDAYHLANTNIAPKSGFVLDYHNWDKLTAANLDVPANVSITDTDIKVVSSKPDPHIKTINTITYEVKIKVGQIETTKTINVPYGAPNIVSVEFWTYNGKRYDVKADALAAAKTGEEAKITSAKKYFYKNVSYDTQALAEAEQTKDITAQIIKTTYGGSIAKPANGQPAPTQTLTTVYVFGGKVYDTLANAQAAWTSAHPDVAEKAGSFNVQYEGTTVKSITIDSANKSVYVSESAAQTDAQGKFTWKYVTTTGQAAQAEQNPTAATLPTTSGTTIKVDNDSYTYHTVGDVTAASNTTTGKKYDAASIASAIEGAVSSTADDSKSVNIDGTVYEFKNVVEKHAQAYTLDQLLKTAGNHEIKIDGNTYWAVPPTSQVPHFGLLRLDSSNKTISSPQGMTDDFNDQLDQMKFLTVNTKITEESATVTNKNNATKAISFVSNSMLSKLDKWLTAALNKLQGATDLTPLDTWNGTDEDNWLWFWQTFSKDLVKSFVDQTNDTTFKVDDIFGKDHHDLSTTAGALSGTTFFDDIHAMAKALGVADKDASAYTNAPDSNLGKNSPYYAGATGSQKMKGIAFASSKPSEMFDANVTGAFSTLSPLDSMKSLLSYWSAYVQRMTAIGKGAIFATNQILMQSTFSSKANWTSNLSSFETGKASTFGILKLQNSLNNDNASRNEALMLSLGTLEDWKNSQFYKDSISPSATTSSINTFAIKDKDLSVSNSAPIFIWNIDINSLGTSLLQEDPIWNDFAKEKLSKDLRKINGAEVNYNGEKYYIAGYVQEKLDHQYIGLYKEKVSIVSDGKELGHLKPVGLASYDSNKVIDRSNGLIVPIPNPPAGPFYMLNNDKYDWTSQEQKTGTTYVPASRKWGVALPTAGDYYKVTNTSKITNGYDYTTTLQDGVEDYLNTIVNALPATEGWYKDNNTANGASPVVLNGTYYVKKGKQDSNHEYVTDKTQGEGYAPATTSSKVDQYQLQYDGVDVAGVTQNVTWTNATKPTAPVVDTSKVTIDSFDAYVAPVVHNVSTESTNDIKSQQITSDIKLVTDAVNNHAPLDVSQVTLSALTGTTWDGWVYDGKIYDTEDAAKTVFKAVTANAVSDQNLKLVYDGTTYTTEDLAKQAAEANSIKIVDASKQTEEQENGVKFKPSFKVNVLIATQDPKDIY